jgi:hypothetical protein
LVFVAVVFDPLADVERSKHNNVSAGNGGELPVLLVGVQRPPSPDFYRCANQSSASPGVMAVRWSMIFA